MLQIWRRVNERIMIGDDIVVTVVDIRKPDGKVRIGVEADRSIPVNRLEIQEQIDAERDAS